VVSVPVVPVVLAVVVVSGVVVVIVVTVVTVPVVIVLVMVVVACVLVGSAPASSTAAPIPSASNAANAPPHARRFLTFPIEPPFPGNAYPGSASAKTTPAEARYLRGGGVHLPVVDARERPSLRQLDEPAAQLREVASPDRERVGRNLDPQLVDGAFGLRADRVVPLRDDGDVVHLLEQLFSERLDLSVRRLPSGEHAEVDANLEDGRLALRHGEHQRRLHLAKG